MGDDDEDINAAIETAPVFGGVVGDGMILGVAGGGEAVGGDAFAC